MECKSVIQKFKRSCKGKLHHLQMQVVTCTFFASASWRARKPACAVNLGCNMH